MDRGLSGSHIAANPSHGFTDDDSSGDDDNDASDDGILPTADFTRGVRRAEGFRGRLRDGVQRALHLLRYVRNTSYRKLRPRGPDDDAGALGEEHHRTPSALDPLREILLASWLNGLVIFVPIGMATYLARMAPILVFASNALAVIPLSSMLTAATEQVASDAGDVVGALLNISLGNLVELILFVALMNNQIRVVQSSILGSILVNSLLILGTALLATSATDHEPVYNTAETQLLSCLLFVSVFVFMMPTAFDYTFDHAQGTDAATLKMTRISALMVLLIYTIYFVHELKTRPLKGEAGRFDVESRQGSTESNSLLDPSHASSPLVLPPRTIRFADQEGTGRAASKPPIPIELGDMDADGNEDLGEVSAGGVTGGGKDDDDEMENRGRRSLDIGVSSSFSGRPRPGGGGGGGGPYEHPSGFSSRGHSRSLSLGSNHGAFSRGSSTSGLMRSGLTTLHLLRENRTSLDSLRLGPGLPQLAPLVPPGAAAALPPRSTREKVVSVLVLIVTSALMSINAEFLVGTIDAVTRAGHLSEGLIGLIIVPVVGNISEYVTVVTLAVRDKLDLAIAVAVGSSIQIALCVAPLTVLAGWALDRELALTFNFFEMAMLVGSAVLVSFLVLNDGGSTLRTSGLKGALMCACYVIIGLGAYLSPNE